MPNRWQLSDCSIFGYVLIFDGLGHYFNKLRTLLLREHRRGVFHGYESFFEEFVGRSAVHLKLPNLPGNASLYCHQKQLASEESFASNEDFWDRHNPNPPHPHPHPNPNPNTNPNTNPDPNPNPNPNPNRQYECNLVPPLDRWFNLQSELYEPHIKKKEDQCVQWRVERDNEQSEQEAAPQEAANATEANRLHPQQLAAEGDLAGKTKTPDWRNYLRERYWAGHRPMITCGREVASRSNWELALHLRLGDLIAPVIGPGDSRREAHYGDRAAQAARGLTRALSLLSHVQTTMRNASAASQFRTLVVSDSPFGVVKKFLEEEAGTAK